MTPDRITNDMTAIASQLRRYVLEPLLSSGFAKAVREAAEAFSGFAAQVQAAEHRERRPRLTDNLPNLHRRYRRPS